MSAKSRTKKAERALKEEAIVELTNLLYGIVSGDFMVGQISTRYLYPKYSPDDTIHFEPYKEIKSFCYRIR